MALTVDRDLRTGGAGAVREHAKQIPVAQVVEGAVEPVEPVAHAAAPATPAVAAADADDAATTARAILATSSSPVT